MTCFLVSRFTRKTYHAGTIPSSHAEIQCHVPPQKLRVEYETSVHSNFHSENVLTKCWVNSALTFSVLYQQLFQFSESPSEVLKSVLQVEVFFFQSVDGVLELIGWVAAQMQQNQPKNCGDLQDREHLLSNLRLKTGSHSLCCHLQSC